MKVCADLCNALCDGDGLVGALTSRIHRVIRDGGASSTIGITIELTMCHGERVIDGRRVSWGWEELLNARYGAGKGVLKSQRDMCARSW